MMPKLNKNGGQHPLNMHEKTCRKSSQKMMLNWSPHGPGTLCPECHREVRRVTPPLDYLNIICTKTIHSNSAPLTRPWACQQARCGSINLSCQRQRVRSGAIREGGLKADGECEGQVAGYCLLAFYGKFLHEFCQRKVKQK